MRNPMTAPDSPVIVNPAKSTSQQEEEAAVGAEEAPPVEHAKSADFGSRMPFWRHRVAKVEKAHFNWATVGARIRKKKLVETKMMTPSNAQELAAGAPECKEVVQVVEVETDEFEEEPLSKTLLRFLLSWEFEIFLLILLAVDVILLIVELEISSKKVCHIVWDTTAGNVVTGTALGTVNCANAPAMTLTCEHSRRFQLNAPYSVCPFIVTEELPHALHNAEIGIGWGSRVVIIIFGLELLALLICAGPHIFAAHKLYLLDALIIGVSIIMDILIATLDLDHIVEIIVVVRLWRFARIVHGVGVSVHDVDEHENHPGDHASHLLKEHPSLAGTPVNKDDAKKKKKEETNGEKEKDNSGNKKDDADGGNKKEEDENKEEKKD